MRASPIRCSRKGTNHSWLTSSTNDRMSGSTIQFTLALFIPIHQSIQRIMLAAPRPKPVPKPEEVLLVDRVQHRRDRALDELVSPPRFPPKPPDPWSLQLHHNFHHVDGVRSEKLTSAFE